MAVLKKKKKRPLTEAEKVLHRRTLLKRWRERNPEYNRQWRAKNKDRVVELKQRWRSDPVNVKREKAWADARKLRGQ